MSRGDFPDDTFTENDVLACLEGAGLHYKRGSRYILSQCPTHEDAHPSVQIYKDDWFVNCHAGCGRFHITKAFPELRAEGNRLDRGQHSNHLQKRENQVSEHKYIEVDLMDEWLQMQYLMDGEVDIHNVPTDVLNELGWRWSDLNKTSIFIPYFSASKGSIPFAQYRHLHGERRFTMLKDTKPTMYGTWNLDNSKLFLVEGCSDAAVLEYAGVPWIAAPSAASGALVARLAGYCKQNDIQLVFAGDNDLAGSKLREALDEIMGYRVKQPPKPYKDWGEFLEATNIDSVRDYCFEELFGKNIKSENSGITDVFPDAKSITVVDPFESKELANEPTPVLF